MKAASTAAASVTSARTVSVPSGPSPERAVTADAVALRDEALGDGAADAAVPAGDEDDAIGGHEVLPEVGG